VNKPGKRLSPALAWIPWWLSAIMAVVSYLGLKHLAPKLAAVSPFFSPLATMLPKIAPLAAIGFLLLAAVLLYDGDEIVEPDDTTEENEDQHSDEDAGSSSTQGRE
jgi:hypothetical protein